MKVFLRLLHNYHYCYLYYHVENESNHEEEYCGTLWYFAIKLSSQVRELGVSKGKSN